MHREREKDNFKGREVKRLKESALALSMRSQCRVVNGFLFLKPLTKSETNRSQRDITISF